MKDASLFFLFIIIGIVSGAQDKSQAYLNSPELKQAITDFEFRLQQTVADDSTGSFSGAIVIGDRIVWSKEREANILLTRLVNNLQ